MCVGLLGGRESLYYIYLYSSQRKDFFFLSSSFSCIKTDSIDHMGFIIYTFSADIIRNHDVKETRSGAFACVPATRVARTELNNTTQHTQKVEYKLNRYYCIYTTDGDPESKTKSFGTTGEKKIYMGRSGASSV